MGSLILDVAGDGGDYQRSINKSRRSKGAASGAKARLLRGFSAGLKPRPSGSPIYEMTCREALTLTAA